VIISRVKGVAAQLRLYGFTALAWSSAREIIRSST
jgi:hypothetical protein